MRCHLPKFKSLFQDSSHFCMNVSDAESSTFLDPLFDTWISWINWISWTASWDSAPSTHQVRFKPTQDLADLAILRPLLSASTSLPDFDQQLWAQNVNTNGLHQITSWFLCVHQCCSLCCTKIRGLSTRYSCRAGRFRFDVVPCHAVQLERFVRSQGVKEVKVLLSGQQSLPRYRGEYEVFRHVQEAGGLFSSQTSGDGHGLGFAILNKNKWYELFKIWMRVEICFISLYILHHLLLLALHILGTCTYSLNILYSCLFTGNSRSWNFSSWRLSPRHEHTWQDLYTSDVTRPCSTVFLEAKDSIAFAFGMLYQ